MLGTQQLHSGGGSAETKRSSGELLVIRFTSWFRSLLLQE